MGARTHHAQRHNGLPCQDQDIQRVPVLVKRTRDEAVVGGIVHRGEKDPVQAQHPDVFIQFVFVVTPHRDLHHRIYHFRQAVAGRYVVPRMHAISFARP
jgi:hypothetical protein